MPGRKKENARSASSREAEAEAEEEVQTKKQKMEMAATELHSLDMSRITAIMNTQGKVLPAVLLKADGEAVEVSFDTTPKLKMVNEQVGCAAGENITFAGTWLLSLSEDW